MRMRTLIRRAVATLLAGSLALQTACYSYAPLQQATPAQARRMAVVINDRGRTMLGERLGANVEQVDGNVVTIDSANVTLDVYRVTDLRGTGTTWTGERVVIPREAILGFRERKLSKARTLLVIGAAVLAIVATLGTSLDVFGDGKTDPPPNGGPQTQ